MTLRILRRFAPEPERGFPCVVEAEVNGCRIQVMGDDADETVRRLAKADRANGNERGGDS